MLPPSEQFDFYCLHLEGLHLLARGDGAAALAALTTAPFTPVHVRYAFPEAETWRPFFPALAADDRGALYRGLEAFDWIRESGLLFPRSDVMGLWSDGREDQFVLKTLDLAVPPLIYAASNVDRFPGDRVTAAVEIVSESTWAVAPGGGFPARIASAIPTLQMHHKLIRLASQLLPRVVRQPRTLTFAQLDAYLAS